MKKNISERVCNKINKAVESAVNDIIKDISKKYNISLQELESEYLNKKKNQNRYTRYSSKRRKELSDDPEMNFGNASKIIGEEWGKLSEKERTEYN